MTHPLGRRIAATLLIGQVSYVVLIQILLGALGPDTAAVDHNARSASGLLLYGTVVIGILVVMAGGAALLAVERVREGVHGLLRTAWLVCLALGELAIAASFLAYAATETFGPDTVIGAFAVVMSVGIAVVCAAEVRAALHALRRASVDVHV
ncbi:hypothetical protein [Streptomyces katsurahamanus]|uniref:DUF2975 domain-containing protein n=1 Tax=Streptomyces katsurahamanus TaxID=2577098 RepID=A0ABW9NVW2_9ACTN|nr:hypothetical protein [Streptomyces katsurahamanus]MQS37455.1 hypothetical protein [Streptomyces katsurahamanus]